MIGFYKINTRHQTKKVLFAILALNAFAPSLSFANDVDQQIPPNVAEPLDGHQNTETAYEIVNSFFEILKLPENLVYIINDFEPLDPKDPRHGEHHITDNLFIASNLNGENIDDFFINFRAILKPESKALTVLGKYIVDKMLENIANQRNDEFSDLSSMTAEDIHQWLMNLGSSILTVQDPIQKPNKCTFQDIMLIDQLRWTIEDIIRQTKTLRSFHLTQHTQSMKYDNFQAFLEYVNTAATQQRPLNFFSNLRRVK